MKKNVRNSEKNNERRKDCTPEKNKSNKKAEERPEKRSYWQRVFHSVNGFLGGLQKIKEIPCLLLKKIWFCDKLLVIDCRTMPKFYLFLAKPPGKVLVCPSIRSTC